jgi:hypothetical protein
MSFERHHPNRDIDRNLAKARDLRSAYLLACLTAALACVLGTGRHRADLPPEPASPRADQAKVATLHSAN